MKFDMDKLLTALLIPFIAAVISTLFTAPSITTWYASMAKPAFALSDNVFHVTWILMYLLMGISLFIVWDSKSGLKGKLMSLLKKKDYSGATRIFGFQLALTVLWSIVFFGLHSPLMAFGVMIVLLASVAVTIIKFFRIDERAGMILVPYLLWVALSTVVNYSVWILN